MQQGISLIIDETNVEMLEHYVKGKRVMSLESKT